ncbi:putative phosphoesterase, ICC [Frankia canadensis]|uniref:Putative phosphoesterase, ICC n=1 Tax=Frankia canadensis TaxID=1836972 RepID=A0A2I2KL32_9ACTN|nr:metallophosphoesterase [Frankia canadensis]SNQ46381.1 putative phosphoesterase, ICC [Frankia canadensis]SOU53671.1 putative phosphoesterase, ICC [Frankia canadensis]
MTHGVPAPVHLRTPPGPTIRVAAVGDIHLGVDSGGGFAPVARGLAGRADVLLLAGDLTQHGLVAEARVVGEEVADAEIPILAVLGNHDYHGDAEGEITEILADAGVTVLEGDGAVLDIGGVRLGVAGVKGFGGGFAGASGSDFGEPLMKAFVRHTKDLSADLQFALEGLDCDIRVALTHYAPVPETLIGERAEIYPFLGSYHLAEAVDAGGADLALHGHAHAGSERGSTAGGVPVRNVARPVIGKPCALYEIRVPTTVDRESAGSAGEWRSAALVAPTAT